MLIQPKASEICRLSKLCIFSEMVPTRKICINFYPKIPVLCYTENRDINISKKNLNISLEKYATGDLMDIG